jgi:MerR-like DNA binding protein
MHPVATTGSRNNFHGRAITSPRAENISIGELSKQSGVNIETIRYYERIKMMPAPPRTASGRRLYGPAERRDSHGVPRSWGETAIGGALRVINFSKVSNIDQRRDREGFHAGPITAPSGIYR